MFSVFLIYLIQQGSGAHGVSMLLSTFTVARLVLFAMFFFSPGSHA